MKPCITVITIGVDDLEASLRFYRDGLGFATEGIVGKEFAYERWFSFDFNRACAWHSGPAPALHMTPDWLCARPAQRK